MTTQRASQSQTPDQTGPTSAAPKREEISKETVAQLRFHAERTGVGAMRLLRGAKDKPTGLNASKVDRWLNGLTKKASAVHVSYVLARWSALPTNNRLPLTLEMRAQLNAELLRTGMGPVLLLKRATDIPIGLTRQIIQAWATSASKPKTVSEPHWSYVMARLGAMPDLAAQPGNSVEGKQ